MYPVSAILVLKYHVRCGAVAAHSSCCAYDAEGRLTVKVASLVTMTLAGVLQVSIPIKDGALLAQYQPA